MVINMNGFLLISVLLVWFIMFNNEVIRVLNILNFVCSHQIYVPQFSPLLASAAWFLFCPVSHSDACSGTNCGFRRSIVLIVVKIGLIAKKVRAKQTHSILRLQDIVAQADSRNYHPAQTSHLRETRFKYSNDTIFKFKNDVRLKCA